MITIRVVTHGLDHVIKGVSAFIREMDNRKEVLQDIKEQQIERWATNFESEGGEYDKWPESAMATQEYRTEEGMAPQPTLQRDGSLMTHFLAENQAGKVTNNAVNWEFTNSPPGGSTVSHHTGYVLNQSTIPARVLWDLDRKDEDRGQMEIEEWLGGLVAKYF